jgi:hypothetical protein
MYPPPLPILPIIWRTFSLTSEPILKEGFFARQLADRTSPIFSKCRVNNNPNSSSSQSSEGLHVPRLSGTCPQHRW